MMKRPAASWKDQPSGTGRSSFSRATHFSAKAPCVAPKTRAPTGNLALAGAFRTVPANSQPEVHGNAGLSVRWEVYG